MEYVIVTGGTSGIGLELARVFAQNGYNLLLVSSNNERLLQTKQKLQNEFTVKILTYQQDLSKTGAALELYNRIKEDRIDISILVNNAGFGLAGASEEIDFVRDERMMILNVISLVELCKLFLADFYRKGKGKILNVASTGAFQPGPYTSTYYGSKVFVLYYSRAIRFEAAKKGVQVCTLCPGATRTNFFAQEGVKVPDTAMSAEEVAEYSYKKLMANKAVIVPGLINKLMKLFPMRPKMKMIAKIKSSCTSCTGGKSRLSH